MLTDTTWLAQNLDRSDLLIVDCRYVLGKEGAGKEAYLAGHIPGAIHLDVNQDLSGKSGPGRHPIPKPTEFSTTMSNAGIDQSTTVIAYDDAGGAWAARLWWLLRYYGHEKVFLLNGGWHKWVEEKRAVTKAVPKVKARSFKATPHAAWVYSKEDIKKTMQQKNALLIDARTPERYRGEVEPIDKRAGHIPGAVNVPFMQNTNPTTKEFKGLEELKKQFNDLGVGHTHGREVICYCGSGVTACNDIFALKMIGIDSKLYEGSWSDWSSDPSLPIEC